MVVGWYHSHPGFGCWLSGVDINTQQVCILSLSLIYQLSIRTYIPNEYCWLSNMHYHYY